VQRAAISPEVGDSNQLQSPNCRTGHDEAQPRVAAKDCFEIFILSPKGQKKAARNRLRSAQGTQEKGWKQIPRIEFNLPDRGVDRQFGNCAELYAQGYIAM
jgi:hypothetical protein